MSLELKKKKKNNNKKFNFWHYVLHFLRNKTIVLFFFSNLVSILHKTVLRDFFGGSSD